MADQDAKRNVPDEIDGQRRTYKGLSLGTALICIGTVLLLNTLDVLDWGVWFDLVKLWPLFLISVGLRMVFADTSLHPLSLLGPLLLVCGTIAVAVTYSHGTSRPALGPLEGTSLELDCPAPPPDTPVQILLRLSDGEIRFVAEPGSASLHSRSTSVPAGTAGLRGGLRYEGRDPRPVCGDKGALRVGRPGGTPLHMVLPFHGGRDRWDAHLFSPSPVDLSLKLTAATAQIDLRAFVLHDVDLETAATSVTLRLGRPRGRVPVRVEGGAVNLEILVPGGTCYTLRRDKALTVLDADDLREPVRRRRRISSTACRSSAPSGDDPHYEFTLELPLSRVSVETDPSGS